MSGTTNDLCSVKVALRVRPLVASEISKGCKDILEVISENEQVIIKNTDKAFTYNYVFGPSYSQDVLYKKCVEPLLRNLYEGFNVTIFAYGQTGSGKTYTMGTTYSGEGEMGIIPRTVTGIFDYIRDNFSIDFGISVTFTELYQEVLFDLLSSKPRDQCALEIKEDQNREICIPGITEIPADSASAVLSILAKGSSGRATSATAMNAQSSRSHAIFTIKLCMQHKNDCTQNKTAKLQFVDLAGSERPKKTGAVGTTFKEGVNINKGLLMLGNVISALGDEKTQYSHISYRDSNLTRLLKDSLGGNSMTLMIACVSPADYNLDETVSTLRYADRARKIKNKPIINQDPKTAEILQLKKKIKELQLQLIGAPNAGPAQIEVPTKEFEESKIKIRDLNAQLSRAIFENTCLHEKIIILQSGNEALNKKLEEIKTQYEIIFEKIDVNLQNNDLEGLKDNLKNLTDIQKHFIEFNTQKMETDAEIRNFEQTFTNLVPSSSETENGTEELQEKQESHTSRQLVLNSELQEITKQLILKEKLALQLATNTNNMVDYNAMAENESKITALEKEKDQLIQQLKNIKTQDASGKISEQRRKKLQELEQQIHDLRRKVTEQARLIKLKEKDEQRIKQLNNEIIQMKQTKTKLVRQMREESDKFRQWKIQQERELHKVKQQDQKKQTEMAKMKVKHEKQQVCLRRKVEAAEALNKRLKEQLALRKQVQESKINGKLEKIGPWLKHELEVFLSLSEAEATLAGLLEDRAVLQEQLEELQSNPETADSPEVKALEEDIELRSVQIGDLQQKLLDSDEETKSKTRFDSLQTMGEAKFALKTIFDETSKIQKDAVQTKIKVEEMQETVKELSEKIKGHELKHKAVEEKCRDQISQVQTVYEEKISILLGQLRGTQAAESHEMYKIQEEKIEMLETMLREKESIIENIKAELALQQELSEQEPKVDKLRRQTHIIQPVPEFNGTFVVDEKQDDIIASNERLDDEIVPSTPDHLPMKKKRMDKLSVLQAVLNESTEIVDDDVNDPDWRLTPIGKRIEREKRRITSKPNLLFPSIATKRSSDGGCTCKRSCSNRCGCKKNNRGCSSSCKCSAEHCSNREDTVSSSENINPNVSNNSSESQEMDDGETTFKKPRIMKRMLK